MKKILLPIENNKEITTIDKAVQIAKKFNSKIVLFHSDNMSELLKDYNYGKVIDKEVINKRYEDTSFLDNLKKLYEEKGIEVETKIVEGDPAHNILEEAKEGDYDLIIMKTHSMKKRKRFLLGSVTNKVIHHINIPILIIR